MRWLLSSTSSLPWQAILHNGQIVTSFVFNALVQCTNTILKRAILSMVSVSFLCCLIELRMCTKPTKKITTELSWSKTGCSFQDKDFETEQISSQILTKRNLVESEEASWTWGWGWMIRLIIQCPSMKMWSSGGNFAHWNWFFRFERELWKF